MIYVDPELIGRADRSYQRRCEREGWLYQIPSSSSSTVEDGIVILRNINGELARYKITPSGRLQWVEEEEAK